MRGLGIGTVAVLLFAILLLPATPRKTDYSRLYTNKVDEVVRVNVYGKYPEYDLNKWDWVYSHGSGIIISPRGHILTAGHVGKTKGTFHIQLQDGRAYDAAFLATAPGTDLAILQPITKIKGLSVAKFASKGKIGSLVFHIGCPMDVEFVFTSGLVGAYDEKYGLISDVTIAGGSSGGPIYNLSGKVVGIAVAILLAHNYNESGFAVFVPSDDAKKFVDSWKEVF